MNALENLLLEHAAAMSNWRHALDKNYNYDALHALKRVEALRDSIFKEFNTLQAMLIADRDCMRAALQAGNLEKAHEILRVGLRDFDIALHKE
jgi:hypothetical protein